MNTTTKKFKELATYRIKAVSNINRKKLTKIEREMLDDELDTLLLTITRVTNNIYEHYSRD